MVQANGVSPHSPVLVFALGNPSRGDDALGPAMYDLLQLDPPRGVELLTDFQLQIEHVVDFQERKYILFIDAGISCADPYELVAVEALRDDSFTSHSMSPQSVLAVFRQVHGCDPPPSGLLMIRGHDFGLGKPLSKAARRNLAEAHRYLRDTPPWSGLA